MDLLTQAKTSLSMLELPWHLGEFYPSAWLMKHKLMEVMRLRKDSRQGCDRVELDDGYFGGQRYVGVTGPDSEDKVPVVTAVQSTACGEDQLVCLAEMPLSKEPMTAFVDEWLVRLLTVVSVGLACFAVTVQADIQDRIVVGAGNASAAHAPSSRSAPSASPRAT